MIIIQPLAARHTQHRYTFICFVRVLFSLVAFPIMALYEWVLVVLILAFAVTLLVYAGLDIDVDVDNPNSFVLISIAYAGVLGVALLIYVPMCIRILCRNASFRYRLDEMLESISDSLAYMYNTNDIMPLSKSTNLSWIIPSSTTAWSTPARNQEIMRSLGWTQEDVMAYQGRIKTTETTIKIGDKLTPTTSLCWNEVEEFKAFRNILAWLPHSARRDLLETLVSTWRNPSYIFYVYETVVKAGFGLGWIHITLDIATQQKHNLPPCGFRLTLQAVKLVCGGELLEKAKLQSRKPASE